MKSYTVPSDSVIAAAESDLLRAVELLEEVRKSLDLHVVNASASVSMVSGCVYLHVGESCAMAIPAHDLRKALADLAEKDAARALLEAKDHSRLATAAAALLADADSAEASAKEHDALENADEAHEQRLRAATLRDAAKRLQGE